MMNESILKTNSVIINGCAIAIQEGTGFLCVSDLRDVCMSVYHEDPHTDVYPNFGMIVNSLRDSECLQYILSILEIDWCDVLFEDETITKILTNCGLYKTTGSKEDKKTFCHPFIWLFIAYLMNPRIGEEASQYFNTSNTLRRIEMCDYISGMMPDWCLEDKYELYLWADKHVNIMNGIYSKNGKEYKRLIRELVSHLEFCFHHGFLKTPHDAFELLRGEINETLESY